MNEAARARGPERSGRSDLPRQAGTYALLLEVGAPGSLEIGGIGAIEFEAGPHLYAGSAFGPGGLAGRLAHHLAPVTRPHWHVDHLRSRARVVGIWATTDARRLECAWARAAGSFRGACFVPDFGASDCGCSSHLVALRAPPRRATFRRHLAHLDPACARISCFAGEPKRGAFTQDRVGARRSS